jgi:hypothetical protein
VDKLAKDFFSEPSQVGSCGCCLQSPAYHTRHEGSNRSPAGWGWKHSCNRSWQCQLHIIHEQPMQAGFIDTAASRMQSNQTCSMATGVQRF